MSYNRQMDNDTTIKCNPTTEFTFKGSQATGDSGGETNNVWNYLEMVNNNDADVNGNKLDFRDNFPQYGRISVFVNGIFQRPRTDYTIASNSGFGTTLTFGGSIANDDDVTFSV